MKRRRKNISVTLTGALLDGFMLLKGYGGLKPEFDVEDTSKIVLTMIHLALVEKDQEKALAIVRGLVEAARGKKAA